MDYQTMIERYHKEKAKAEEMYNLALQKSQAETEYWEYMQYYCMHKAAMTSAIKAADHFFQQEKGTTDFEPNPE